LVAAVEYAFTRYFSKPYRKPDPSRPPAFWVDLTAVHGLPPDPPDTCFLAEMDEDEDDRAEYAVVLAGVKDNTLEEIR
jgi:hypothetical protein